jgi:hypothetical protein
MRQLLVGSSVDLGVGGPVVTAALGDSGVGCGEDSVLDGVGGVKGAEAEHAAVTTKVITPSRLPSPRLKLTSGILDCPRELSQGAAHPARI